MKNWLGQEIAIGDVVGRGARAGNTSNFKVGIVDVIDGKGVKVKWLYEQSGIWVGSYPNNKRVTCPWRLSGTGRPDVNSLFRLTQEDLERCEELALLVDAYRVNEIDVDYLVDRLTATR